MNQRDADVLFQYLKEILYERNTPKLSEQDISPECKKLVDGMNLLNRWVEESNQFAQDIAEGNLNGEEPSKDNPLNDSLKRLRSNISHLIWQTKRVAEGDYSQRVAMLGDFSDSFNSMTAQLEQRESALKEHNALLSYITDNIREFVIVLDDETKKLLYENKVALDFLEEEAQTAEVLRHALEAYQVRNSGRSWEMSLSSPDDTEQMLFYHIDSFRIDWQGRQATAHLLRNVTKQREWEFSIEYVANTDALSGLYNRRYCINLLNRLIANKMKFFVCFADLDKLKYVNDKFGHCCGDEFIRTVSSVLKENFRGDDAICRIGGDEFIILMQGCVEQHAVVRMEQVRSRLSQIAQEKNLKYEMSISYGIVTCDKTNTMDAEELLSKADKKMYLYKEMHGKS